MTAYLAHSELAERAVPAQPYRDHVVGVAVRAYWNARTATAYWTGDQGSFARSVFHAALVHDLGKLDEANQAALLKERSGALPVSHVDAGVAFLRGKSAVGCSDLNAAILVYAHHGGLPAIRQEARRQEKGFRNAEIAELVDAKLPELAEKHRVFAQLPRKSVEPRAWDGLTWRIALSCLVDADHTDTANHYLQDLDAKAPLPRWQERLKALDDYVRELFAQNPQVQRNILRMQIYESCRASGGVYRISACDSPVGSGKTTAIMAHLICAAIKNRQRHIFVVLPFTNIITQTVRVLREALTLPGENPEAVVAEHHHQADFEALSSRHLACLWRAPIIVTTAVQFFETLAASRTGRLRKLHELPGSGIFLDEVHASLPGHLWPQGWRWLKGLTEKWNATVVLASGSLPRFWEIEAFSQNANVLPQIVPDPVRHRAGLSEHRRIRHARIERALDVQGLAQRIVEEQGAKLVILNTVQGAAVVAENLRCHYGEDVLHLSTALAPVDREPIIGEIQRRLNRERGRSWTLVATSCVEAGMDFSFDTGFRERCSVASLIQTGGRVNRDALGTDSVVWDFHMADPLVNAHPAFEMSRNVLLDFFEAGKVDCVSPSDLVTMALDAELKRRGNRGFNTIVQREAILDFPRVGSAFRVIPADTRCVLVKHEIADALEQGQRVAARVVMKNSVQLWSTKIDLLNLKEVEGVSEIYKWPFEYDGAFLGYMAGLLPLLLSHKDISQAL